MPFEFTPSIYARVLVKVNTPGCDDGTFEEPPVYISICARVCVCSLTRSSLLVLVFGKTKAIFENYSRVETRHTSIETDIRPVVFYPVRDRRPVKNRTVSPGTEQNFTRMPFARRNRRNLYLEPTGKYNMKIIESRRSFDDSATVNSTKCFEIGTNSLQREVKMENRLVSTRIY